MSAAFGPWESVPLRPMGFTLRGAGEAALSNLPANALATGQAHLLQQRIASLRQANEQIGKSLLEAQRKTESATRGLMKIRGVRR